MSLATLDELILAMASSSAQLLPIIAKNGKPSQLAGGFSSNWNGTGTPAASNIPAAAEVPTSATLGALAFNNPGGGLTSYIARVACSASVNGAALRISDRIGQMGGLSGTSTSAQTVGVDVTGSSNNLAVRRGRSDYTDVAWFLEWYTDTGSTAVTATVTYTNAAGASGLTVAVPLAATMRSGRMLPIIPDNGDAIRSIQSVTLSASTGTAGNFGVTAQRLICEVPNGLANTTTLLDWAGLGLPIVANDACLAVSCINPGAAGITFNASLLLVHA